MSELRRLWGISAAILILLAAILGLSCRKELPELFDRNQAPETYITAAPVESLFDGFKIHLSWYGLDPDGEIAYFLWSWTDSSQAFFSSWNPETRAQDRILREGDFDATHLTTRTDSVFFVLANDEGGTSRDLTFNITAVDDKGRRDPLPARHYFTASVDSRPEIIWLQRPPDTLSVGEGFGVQFEGRSYNTASDADSSVLGFQWTWGTNPSWFPQNVVGEPIWTYQIDCDGEPNVPLEYCSVAGAEIVTLNFDNNPIGPNGDEWLEFYQFGSFLVKAKCTDIAGVESEVSSELDDLLGAVAPILNRDPDTRLRPVEGDEAALTLRYRPYGEEQFVELDVPVRLLTPDEVPDLPPGFHYAVDDTLPWGEDTWLTLNMQGWDLDNPVVVPDEEIETRFQMEYEWSTPNLGALGLDINAKSQGRYPGSASAEALGFSEVLDDIDPNHWGAAGQHYEMNLLPVNYLVRGYALDHFKRVDGTPFTLRFNAGFMSSVDSIILSSPGDNVPGRVDILNRSEPVNTELIVYPIPPPYAPPEDLRFVWDEDSNTGALAQISIEGIPGVDSTATVEFDLQLEIYGHDDPRNGQDSQLGRIRWDLRDSSVDENGDLIYPSSYMQFDSESFWIERGAYVRAWDRVDPEQDPGIDGVHVINLRIRALYDDVLAATDTPSWLGEKSVYAQFTNTGLSQSFEEYIESTSQRRLQMVSIGRTSEERSNSFTVTYGGGPPPPGGRALQPAEAAKSRSSANQFRK